MRAQLLCGVIIISTATYARAQEARPIVQIVAAGGIIVGQVIDEDDSQIRLNNIKTGTTQTLSKDEVRTRKEITDEAASASVGLPAMMAWRIKQVMPSGDIKGSVVKLADERVYVSLGTSHGISAATVGCVPGQQ